MSDLVEINNEFERCIVRRLIELRVVRSLIGESYDVLLSLDP